MVKKAAYLFFFEVCCVDGLLFLEILVPQKSNQIPKTKKKRATQRSLQKPKMNAPGNSLLFSRLSMRSVHRFSLFTEDTKLFYSSVDRTVSSERDNMFPSLNCVTEKENSSDSNRAKENKWLPANLKFCSLTPEGLHNYIVL